MQILVRLEQVSVVTQQLRLMLDVSLTLPGMWNIFSLSDDFLSFSNEKVRSDFLNEELEVNTVNVTRLSAPQLTSFLWSDKVILGSVWLN